MLKTIFLLVGFLELRKNTHVGSNMGPKLPVFSNISEIIDNVSKTFRTLYGPKRLIDIVAQFASNFQKQIDNVFILCPAKDYRHIMEKTWAQMNKLCNRYGFAPFEFF